MIADSPKRGSALLTVLLVRSPAVYVDAKAALGALSFSETWHRLLRSLRNTQTSSDRLLLLNFLFHAATAPVFVLFVLKIDLASLCLFSAFSLVLGHIYNTLWYHRYCCHQAFQFRKRWLTTLFLYTNPFVLREETYVVPHYVHHAYSDTPIDPYGPHLGWLGSYFAPELSQRIRRDVPREGYRFMANRLAHVSMPLNNYEDFSRSGCLERPEHYLARTISSHALWITAITLLLGPDALVPFYAAIFFATVLMRDFNWRGHRSTQGQQRPRNQAFYALIASEWHANHHAQPRSASSGNGVAQFDLVFHLIRLLNRIGLISRYRGV